MLSAGADPMSTIVRFATEMSYLDRMHAISLGQGQGPIAEKLIEQMAKKGDWVVLQNCHLAKSWMPKLEKIVESFPADANLHDDFRLWLTSMPAKYFPVPVLQSACKLTFEPPKGMRANLIGTWAAMTKEDFEDISNMVEEWKKLLFGLTFFHAVVQERRKFGPLGWNVRYDFNTTDMEISVQMLRMFLNEQPEIPWEAIMYLGSQIHYGGRVTDSLDKRTAQCILGAFFCKEILVDGYQFANDSNLYHCAVLDRPRGLPRVRRVAALRGLGRPLWVARKRQDHLREAGERQAARDGHGHPACARRRRQRRQCRGRGERAVNPAAVTDACEDGPQQRRCRRLPGEREGRAQLAADRAAARDGPVQQAARTHADLAGGPGQGDQGAGRDERQSSTRCSARCSRTRCPRSGPRWPTPRSSR